MGGKNELDNRISVVVPCYNSQDTIGECLRSLVLQDVRLKEIIVVDDNSGDDTARIVRENAAGSPVPVRLLRHSRNRGEGAARNTGAVNCTGEFFIQTDSDAVYSRNYCRKVCGLVARTPKSMSSGGLRSCWGSDGNRWKVFWDAYHLGRWKLLRDGTNKPRGAWCFRKSDYIASGGYNALRSQGTDVDLVCTMESRGFRNLWTPNVRIRHLEPQDTRRVFRRFCKSGQTIEVRRRGKMLLRTFAGSTLLLLLTFTGIVFFAAPLMVLAVRDASIGFRYLLFRKKDLAAATLFPWQYFFYRFASAWGIFWGTLGYFRRKAVSRLRRLQGEIYFSHREAAFGRRSLLPLAEMEAVPVVINIDDFSPAAGGDDWLPLDDGSRFNPYLAELLEQEDARVTLFSVASFHIGNRHWPVSRYPSWTARVREYGERVEIAVHGLDHYNAASKTRMVEFEGLSEAAVSERLSRAKQLWAEAGIPVAGVRPPGWGLGRGDALIRATLKGGYAYASFASGNDGVNRYLKNVSTIHPVEFRGVLHMPQNIGVWDGGVDEKLRYIVRNSGVVSIKLHYGDYNYAGRFCPADRLNAAALERLREILAATRRIAAEQGRNCAFYTFAGLTERIRRKKISTCTQQLLQS